MKIASIEVYRYSLPLVEALEVKGRSFVFRSGLLLRLTGDDGLSGVGEAAPLPGYSPDTLDEVIAQAATLADLAGTVLPEGLERLDGGFETWLGARSLSPSLRCALEVATLNLLASQRAISLRRLLNAGCSDRVTVMGLLNGNLGEIRKKAQYLHHSGYGAVKLKVGRFPLADEVLTVQWVHRHFAGQVSLRLDANRAWDIETAYGFARQTEECEIAYIEEPLNTPGRFTEFGEESGLPVALDESLRDMAPEELRALPNISTIVLKPTVLGLERAVRFARHGVELGITPVVSSCFESGFGLSALLQIAAAIEPEGTPSGLDTYEWLDADVFPDRLPIRKPIIDLPELESLAQPIAFDRLQRL